MTPTDEAGMTADDNSPDGAGTVRAVQRALTLLRAIGDGGRTTSELQRSANIPGPTAVRLLRTLEHEGFVARTETGFVLGPEMTRLFAAIEPHSTTWTLIRAAVDELRKATDETAQFMVESAGMREVIYVAESAHETRRVLAVGSRYRLHHGASGKIFVGYRFSDADLAALSDDGETYLTRTGARRTIALLKEEGARAVTERVSHAVGPESWAVAAPVLRRGVLLGTLSVGVPSVRYSEAALERCRAACHDIALRVSSTLDRVGDDLAEG